MKDTASHNLEQLDNISTLIQSWSDNKNSDASSFPELLLELDLIINELNAYANTNNDHELVDLYSHFQNNIVLLYETKASTKQMELICAWPIYISEFVANREDEETITGLLEFLSDSEWPHDYSQSNDKTQPETVVSAFDGDELLADVFEKEISTESVIDNNDNSAISSGEREFLDLINAEIIDIQEAHGSRFLEAINSSSNQSSDLHEEIETQVDQLDRIGSAADMVGLRGLKKFCIQLQNILNHINESDLSLLPRLKEQVLVWPDIIQAYLSAPSNTDFIFAALDYLNLDCWPVQLKPVEQKDFEEAFNTSKVEVDTNQTPDRIREATLEHISLNKPDDIPDELLDSLLQDLPEQTSEFSFAIQNLRNEDYIQQLEVSKRIAHTLKGAGNTVGIQGLANLTHHLEDILEALLKDKEQPAKNLHNVLENAADCLEEMSEYLHGMGQAPNDTLQVLQEVLDWANHIDKHGIPEEYDDLQDKANTQESNIEKDKAVKQSSEEIISTENEHQFTEATAEQSIRIATNLIDDLLKRTGENIISNAQIQEFILRSKQYTKNLRENNNKIENIANELGHLIEVRGFSSQYTSNTNHNKFDPLEMDQFNELNTYSNLLIEAIADSNEFAIDIEKTLLKLENVSASQRHSLNENQEAVLNTRMVPVKSIVQRLKRSVKQANKISNKTVELVISGEDILIDSDILNQLTDPLMHILRNAVDHGIEHKEHRIDEGKNENGLIKLSFYKNGKQIRIRCEDDGKGLDIDSIKSKALNMGLLDEDQSFEKEDALKLILQHGFSTKEDVTQLSGRGVGMDVVFSEVRNLKGSITMYTYEGEGTTIELNVPMTFHSTQALLVTCADYNIALSNRGIEEILHPGAGGIISVDGKPVFSYKQKHYPIFDLQGLLFSGHINDVNEPSQAVLIIKDEFDKSHAILLDKILDSREIVIKPFSQFIPKMSGLLGSTIIGDGSVISVLDLLDIINTEEHDIERIDTNRHKQTTSRSGLNALIVEDAISTRKSLAQFMQDLGFNVETAKDGVEAINKLQKQTPSIILTDLEMPRMNGLELTDHLRSNEGTQDIPIIMITSRATKKHKEEALRIGVTEYMTKPYDEDALLNHVNTLNLIS